MARWKARQKIAVVMSAFWNERWGWSYRAIHDFDNRDKADKFAEEIS